MTGPGQRPDRKSVLKGGSLLALGNAGAQGLSFLRNLIIARMLGLADVDVAVAFAVVLSLIEITSDLAADKLLVQAEDGDEPRLQNTAHAIQVLRGVLGAAVMLVCAPWIAAFFGVADPNGTDATETFRWLALVPLIRSLAHLDVRRIHRTMRFGPSVMLDASGHLVATALAVPMCLWIGTYEAAMWLLVAQSAVVAIGSHVLAERRYGWALSKHDAGRIIAFGWPLLFNGLLMFFIFQGDKAIVGNRYPEGSLALYGTAMFVAQLPSTLATKTVISLGLPVLSRAKDAGDERRFGKVMMLLAGALAASGGAGIAAMIAGGAGVVELVYGSKFVLPAGLAAWLGAMWGVRLLRVAPTLAAMAHGDTKTGLIGNVGRAVGLAAALWCGIEQMPLWTIAASGAAGEILAMLVTGYRVAAVHKLGFGVCGWPMVFAGVASAGGYGVYVALGDASALVQTLGAVGVAGVVGLVGVLAFGDLRSEALGLVRRRTTNR